MSRLHNLQQRHFFRSHRLFARFRRNPASNFSHGNRVTLYQQGGDFFQALFASLKQATSYICLEFYLVRDDRLGRELAEILLAAVERGVRVYFLYDYMGSFDTSGSFFRNLEKGGVRCVAFNPPPFRRGLTWFDKRDHRKIVVIDGRMAFTGGLNIGDEYAGFGDCPYRWRDLGIKVEGAAVEDLLRLFRENWHGETRTTPAADADTAATAPQGEGDEVMIVSGGPHHNRSLIRAAFRMAIAGAATSIKVETPYFIPGPRLLRSLLRAARRGVEVQLILPAQSDVPLVQLVSRSLYAPLLKGGIKIAEREGTVLHAKIMLVDNAWAIIGSANLDQRSFHRNYEVNVIVASQEFGDQVDRMIADDLARSRPVVLEEHERRGGLVRLLERLGSTISWFL